MSNFYLEYRFTIPIPSKELLDKAVNLLSLANDYWDVEGEEALIRKTKLSNVFCDFEEYEELGFDWHTIEVGDKFSLEISGEENGNVQHAMDLIGWLLPDLDVESVGFSYAYYGSSDIGGGAVLVTKDPSGKIKYDSIDTADWLRGKLREH